MQPSTQYIISRLHILRKKLEDEGLYVRANTASLAIEEIKRLQTLIEGQTKESNHETH